MKKLFFMLMLLMLCSTALVSADSILEVNNIEQVTDVDYAVQGYDEDYNTRNIYLSEGWNLLPYGDGVEMDYSRDFEENLLAAYIYHPYDRVFYDIMEDDDELEYVVDVMGFTSIWVYMEEDTNMVLRVESDEVLETIQETRIEFADGWNFYVLLPQMQKNYPGAHFNIHERDGTSYMESMYMWDSYSKEWENIYGDFLDWEETEDDFAAYPVLIKYWDEFEPTLETSTPVIPPFPY
ncbi:hypothetical protein HN592_05530 [Candidatus Woesearchaeota archaeon]|jgi:hypothetical protein|nr:hypothetical protein [Candidatus Woesearchaeota archaeon]MBT4367945.1 hypothetical protein [Candidatus Woesearchaeota archaeon]MBT4712433.1 hypothetical protein [Candidatus Woesearchaeota archaeon]MBT6639345.1 hypothetical protein [Candidatus Woesearchaeota archaeon]MBT7133518.1 hypothetical protein [Candidatus Woesearchaeota archaeon]